MSKKPGLVPVVLTLLFLIGGAASSTMADVGSIATPTLPSGRAARPFLPSTVAITVGIAVITVVAFVATSTPVAAATEDAALTQIAVAATATTGGASPDSGLQSTVRRVTARDAARIAKAEFDS
jgi:hypothetical protein